MPAPFGYETIATRYVVAEPTALYISPYIYPGSVNNTQLKPGQAVESLAKAKERPVKFYVECGVRRFFQIDNALGQLELLLAIFDRCQCLAGEWQQNRELVRSCQRGQHNRLKLKPVLKRRAAASRPAIVEDSPGLAID